jgi:DNA polymerase III subunit epsilon
MNTFLAIIIIGIVGFIIYKVWLVKYFKDGYYGEDFQKAWNETIKFDDSISKIGKYLVVDIETTGLPINRNNEPENVNNWPRIIQFAWILFDAEYKLITKDSHIIMQPHRIPPDSIRIHGITDERARKEGKEASYVLSEFINVLDKTEFVIAHNIDFDIPIIDSEFIRLGKGKQFSSKTLICTMKSSIDFCKLGEGGRNKYPKLEELYQKCYYPQIRGKLKSMAAHDALNDACLAAKCFIKLKELDIIDDSQTAISYDKRTKEEKEQEQEFYLDKRREELTKPYKPKVDFTLEFETIVKNPKLKKGDSLKIVFEDMDVYLKDPVNLVIHLADQSDKVIGKLRFYDCVKPIKVHHNGYELETTHLGYYNDRYVVFIHPVKLL